MGIIKHRVEIWMKASQLLVVRIVVVEYSAHNEGGKLNWGSIIHTSSM